MIRPRGGSRQWEMRRAQVSNGHLGPGETQNTITCSLLLNQVRPRAPRECLNTGPSRWGAERGEGNHIVHTWPPTYRGKKRPIFIGRNKELSLAESKSLLLLDLRGSAR